MFVYRPKQRILRYSIASFTCELSMLAGAAFVTQPSVDLTRYIGCKLTLNDGVQSLVGWIKAAGAAETLDSELVGAGNCFNSATYPYETFDGASATGFHAIKSAIGAKYAGTADQIIYSAGVLYKVGFTLTRTSGLGPEKVGHRASLSGTLHGMNYTPAAGANIAYSTATESSTGLLSFYSGGGAPETTEFTVAGITFKPVLAPSATGVTIWDLTDDNWVSDGGIDPNAASFTATITSI